jgi:tRNA G18 (ribose-2'-O)-methylase SpoU
VPLVEVPETELLAYMQDLKSEGYTLLGVEQTANSKNLISYNFPERCALLLGKEKEGIPAEFIQLLDECIEVPQLGVIRSLNVHVTGSIFLYPL